MCVTQNMYMLSSIKQYKFNYKLRCCSNPIIMMIIVIKSTGISLISTSNNSNDAGYVMTTAMKMKVQYLDFCRVVLGALAVTKS